MDLRVNYPCKFNHYVIVGNHCNFNGMQVRGGDFADYFHSSTECMIITQNHNYEREMIPYDNTYI